MRCKRCDAEIPAENVNVQTFVAHCTQCNSVFNFGDPLDLARDQKTKGLRVPMPKGFKVEDTGFELKITCRWFNFRSVFLFLCALFFNGMIGFMSITLIMGISQETGRPPLVLAVLVPFAGVGMALLYWALAGWLNRTEIKASPTSLDIKHGPLPFPGKRLDPGNIVQLYCKERIHHHADSDRDGASTSYSYELHAITGDGKQEKLVTGLHESEQALYLEQQLEQFLKVENRPVAGELSHEQPPPFVDFKLGPFRLTL